MGGVRILSTKATSQLGYESPCELGCGTMHQLIFDIRVLASCLDNHVELHSISMESTQIFNICNSLIIIQSHLKKGIFLIP